ncbi:hypothetical protein [Psychrobacter sp. AOP31-E1-50]|uniref:hypothetical protein n=1 Tax=Psychrobacter sp. AOP31-E1-50 TaxID=3457692 RepID=UPI003FDB8EA3
MADPIIFTITEAGKQAAFAANADSAQLKINLTQVAVGTKKRAVTGNETALTTEFKRGSIVSGDVEAQSNTLRFTSSMTANVITDIYEIGLMTDDNVLFAIAGSNAAPLFSLHPDVTFVIALGLSLDDIDASNITVTTDTNGALSIVMMENHLAAPDPHPQYLNKNRFQLAMRALYPMGYQYHSHEPVNPKPIFDDILGLDTAWRRVTGKIFVSSDPSDPFINTYGLVLGQKGMTEVLASGARPHVYPLQTTHTFERYNPDDVIATVWNVKASKTSINEGGAVRFTVTANNLPDGQILNWSVKEGALNGSNNDITSPDKTDSGTVILRNGQAVIDFTTTPDDNVAEPQKHVRLTVGAPANLSINVPVNDAGHNETALHITQSTTNGIDLAEYYKQQSGSYPTATDKVRFIVDAGVDIVAPNTSTPAMIEGSNWTSGAEIVVENRGRILGRGGDGGMGAVTLIDSYNRNSFSVSDVATAGKNGGTAIKGSIEVDNYGVIAGGGGGGGGGGAWSYNEVEGEGSAIVGQQNGTASGGGAPYGLATLNAGSAEWFLADNRNPDLNLIKSALEAMPNNATIKITPSAEVPSVILESTSQSVVTLENFNFRPALKVPTTLPKAVSAIPNGEVYDLYKSDIDSDTQDRVFFQYIWSDLVYERYNLSGLCKRALNGGVTSGGVGGYSVGTYWPFHFYKASVRPNLSKSRGGKGGDIGENGENGIIESLIVQDTIMQPPTFRLFPKPETTDSNYKESSPASGGLAGYIKEGSVTINNLSGGTTKGR